MAGLCGDGMGENTHNMLITRAFGRNDPVRRQAQPDDLLASPASGDLIDHLL